MWFAGTKKVGEAVGNSVGDDVVGSDGVGDGVVGSDVVGNGVVGSNVVGDGVVGSGVVGDDGGSRSHVPPFASPMWL